VGGDFVEEGEELDAVGLEAAFTLDEDGEGEVGRHVLGR